jgi:DNA repair protein RadC
VLVRLIGSEAVEVCGLLCLSVRWEVLAYHELSRGTLDATIIHPRDVLRTALLANARAVIIGHNHPSGEVSPSRNDSLITERLARAAEIIGVQLVDHLIVSAAGRHFSFREAGLLTQPSTREELYG